MHAHVAPHVWRAQLPACPSCAQQQSGKARPELGTASATMHATQCLHSRLCTWACRSHSPMRTSLYAPVVGSGRPKRLKETWQITGSIIQHRPHSAKTSAGSMMHSRTLQDLGASCAAVAHPRPTEHVLQHIVHVLPRKHVQDVAVAPQHKPSASTPAHRQRA